MSANGFMPLTAETTAGRADLLVDAERPLQDLLAALAAATGADPTAGWQVTEGQRTLTAVTFSLRELGVVAGSVLRLHQL